MTTKEERQAEDERQERFVARFEDVRWAVLERLLVLDGAGSWSMGSSSDWFWNITHVSGMSVGAEIKTWVKSERMEFRGYFPPGFHPSEHRWHNAADGCTAMEFEKRPVYRNITVDVWRDLEKICAAVTRRFLPGYRFEFARMRSRQDWLDARTQREESAAAELAEWLDGKVTRGPNGRGDMVGFEKTVGGCEFSGWVRTVTSDDGERLAVELKVDADTDLARDLAHLWMGRVGGYDAISEDDGEPEVSAPVVPAQAQYILYSKGDMATRFSPTRREGIGEGSYMCPVRRLSEATVYTGEEGRAWVEGWIREREELFRSLPAAEDPYLVEFEIRRVT